MNTPRINGKKLVLVGGLLLLVVAASARVFARYYLRDMKNPPAAATEPSANWH